MDRLRVSTVTPAQCQAARNPHNGSRKRVNGEFDPDQQDDYSVDVKIERIIPLVRLTDAYLATTPETGESLAALRLVLEARK